MNYGLLLFEQDEAAGAAEAFQRVLDDKLLPERAADLYFYLTGAWTLAKDYDKALLAAREAAKREPNSPRMVAREAWVLYQAKRLDEAELAYRQRARTIRHRPRFRRESRIAPRHPIRPVGHVASNRTGWPMPRNGCNKCWTNSPRILEPSTTSAIFGAIRASIWSGP